MATIQALSADWLKAKADEILATHKRRKVEDQLFAKFNLPESFCGTCNKQDGEYQIKVVGRATQKVDSAALQEIAAEKGLTEHLSALFRWKAEINSAAWNGADDSITTPLLAAITTTPGRASFTIITKGE